MKKCKKVPVKELPCYAVYSEDFHWSDQWANKMVSLWVKTRLAMLNGDIQASKYRDCLLDGIIEASGGWRDDFRQAAKEAGADPNDDVLFNDYVAMHRENAFDLIPKGLYAELCWIPEWDGGNLDDLMETHGLRSTRWRSTSIGDIEPGDWLMLFLKMVNVSSRALIEAAINSRGEDGSALAVEFKAESFKVKSDPSKPSLMTPADVITTIENAYCWAVPIFHCEVEVRTLFDMDPGKDIRFTSNRGQVHLGLHDFVLNGAGHIDSYPGEITIPSTSKGFVGAERMKWTVNSVYGLVKSYFYTTPTQD